MADDSRDRLDPTLDDELRRLGPLMREQERAEAQEPDPVFVQALRARLTGESAASAAHGSQAIPVQEPLPITRKRRVRPVFLSGLVTAAIAAALIALVIDSRRAESPGARHIAAPMAIPMLNRTDVIRSYPVPGGIGAGGLLQPWQPLLDFYDGVPYPKHLRLATPSFTRGPTRLEAYRLAGPRFNARSLGTLARRLGIRGAVKETRQPDGLWAYAADTPAPSRSSPPGLHSVAINLSTGRLIYHDTGYVFRTRENPGLNAPRNVAIARAWMVRAGWPDSMPVQPVSSQGAGFGDWLVTLGWSGTGPTATAAAILQVGADAVVHGAEAWPRAERTYTIPVRSYARAWQDVRDGKAPVGVHLVGQEPPGNGTGTVSHTDVLNVLTRGKGRMFLVPAYRFSGLARIQGLRGPRSWLSLVPASK